MIRLRGAAFGERGKLTLVYGGLLIAMSTVLVIAVYLAFRWSLPDAILVALDPASSVEMGQFPDTQAAQPVLPEGGEAIGDGGGEFALTRAISVVATEAALTQYLVIAIGLLVILGALSMWLAWWLAGRVLSPVGQMATAARSIAVTDLSRRIDLDAPPGELKQLADTFDELLDRIDTLVGSQQRFVANAAHELRTQLAVQRSAAEIGLVDPTPERVARIREKLIDAAIDNEHLLEGLLVLASSDQGLQHEAPVQLDEVSRGVAAECATAAAGRGIALTVAAPAGPTQVNGDAVLLKHLVRNLVENAIAYNLTAQGTVSVELMPADASLAGQHSSGPMLVVSNTGAEIDPALVDGLFEPFRRLHPRQHRPGEGAGLGLAIVASIARAHGAEVSARAQVGGGLEVRVGFPD